MGLAKHSPFPVGRFRIVKVLAAAWRTRAGTLGTRSSAAGVAAVVGCATRRARPPCVCPAANARALQVSMLWRSLESNDNLAGRVVAVGLAHLSIWAATSHFERSNMPMGRVCAAGLDCLDPMMLVWAAISRYKSYGILTIGAFAGGLTCVSLAMAIWAAKSGLEVSHIPEIRVSARGLFCLRLVMLIGAAISRLESSGIVAVVLARLSIWAAIPRIRYNSILVCRVCAAGLKCLNVVMLTWAAGSARVRRR